MIITSLAGGLGNQLFQYAFGCRTALARGTLLKLDISKTGQNGLRPYCLKHFNIVEEFATAADLEWMARRVNGLERLGLMPLAKRTWIVEPEGWFQSYNPALLKIQDNAYIEGYWQSPKYFADCESVIRQDLTLRVPPDQRNQALADWIADIEAVSVHIRRGDYLTRPTALEKFARCSDDYYRRAMDSLRERSEQPHFILFSDEPEWARENFAMNSDITVIDGNGGDNDYLDLWLMSLCKHHIIANSSFSWWGAWLGCHADKIVIAPRRWFNLTDEQNDSDGADRIPDGWIRI